MPITRNKTARRMDAHLSRTVHNYVASVSKSSFEGATFYMIGAWLTFEGLSEATLNKRRMQVVRILPDDPSLVCVDATPKRAPPEQVRYVNLPIAKAKSMRWYDDELSDDSACVWQFIHSDNRSDVLSSWCLDANQIECLSVRPHPSVHFGYAWSDLPILCEELNRSRSPGSPFRLEVGFNLFCTSTIDKVRGVVEGYYSAQPHLILRDCRGCGIDVTPSRGELSLVVPNNFACGHKLYVADPRLDYVKFMNVLDAVKVYVECGMMANVVHKGYTRGCKESPVTLGMIDDNINAKWHADGFAFLATPFLNPHMRLDVVENKRMIAKFINGKRSWIANGCVWVSLNLLHKLVEVHGDDDEKEMQLLSISNLGVICYGCHVRTTEQESRLCGGCGKARYCSEACQRNHWSCHKLRCVSKEERDRRREMTRKVKEEHEERVRKYEAREAKIAEEVRQQNAVRTERIAKEREEREEKRLQEVAERVRRAESAAWRPPRQVGKKGGDKVDRPTQEKLVHKAWDSERERAARSAAFDSKQAEEHEQAVLRRREARASAMRKLEADASAAEEAARHVVPPSPRLSEFL